MNIKEFIEYIITFENVDDILDEYETQSEKGFIFERLFDIVIKFGFCDIFSNTEYDHLMGNTNNGKLKILKHFHNYLDKNVFSGNSGGCSDITLKNKNDDTYIFISSKYPKSSEDIKKQKSVKYYNIQDIIAITTKNKYIYEQYKIYLVVPDKKKVLLKAKKSKGTSKYITDHISENTILDKNDLNIYFLKFKQDIIKNKNEDWDEVYLTGKEKLTLRFHQELITQKTSDLIEEGNKSFLWGCKCRSGKTYMIGGIIIKQFEIKKKLNVLIITPVPTETAPQFTNELFNKFRDFDKFTIHHIKKSSMINKIETTENNIFVMSKQLLQIYINDNTILSIKNLKLDIIGFDENHFGGTTDLSKEILKSYSTKNTTKIYLTATFNKPSKEWNISEECKMFWDMDDEKICKNILVDENNLVRLKEKHNYEYVEKIIKYYMDLGMSLDNIFKCYEKMPELHLITTMFDQKRYNTLKEEMNKQDKIGFCFETLLSLNSFKTQFNFPKQVESLLRYISGSKKETDGDKTIFTRISYICSEKETRTPFTQIWFLPSNNINEISLCLKKLMEEDLVLKEYDVLCINSKNTPIKDIKEEINKKEIEAKKSGKYGIIILAGNMLSLGITLNLCDLVILMNNSLSSDKVFQQMYRSMTEDIDKKIGFVVDLNISRVLNICVNYTICKNEKNINDKITYLVKNRLIHIDFDMMINKQVNSDMLIKKLMDMWKEDPINNFISLLKNLDNEYINFDNSTQDLINKKFIQNIKNNKVNLHLKFKDENDELQKIESGIEITKIVNTDKTEEDKTDEEDKKEENLQISFTKDVLPYIIPLTCILTVKTKNMDFVNMLNDIKENPELLEIFDDQCLIWWNKKDLIDIIKNIISKYFDKDSNTYNISVQFKMSLQSLIDNPKELLELIAECLKPKDVEKKQFGEVFTPMKLVNEMLDKLPIEVWTNKKFKWLDPCCGMGNFPIAVYLRLMEGLKEKIVDNKKRKKHILENMLYMCELNKKNVLICNQIFNINNQYKLNIYEGDSLKLNYNEQFGIEQFDIIVGNPPYQDNSGNKGNKLWTKFVELMIKKLLKNNGFLLFVHPSLWRQIDHKIQKIMTNNQIIYLEIHNEKDGLKTFSANTRYVWYLLQNIKYTYNTTIKGEDGIISEININKMRFIPNNNFETIHNLTSSKNKVNILHSESIYEPRKKWMNSTHTDLFKYPCIYSINKNNIPSFKYSSLNNKGHFGISKIIWGGGSTGFIIDNDGKYGMTQWSSAIEDKIENLPLIKKALESKKFNNLIKSISVSKQEINYKILREFNKDFYNVINCEN
jgi:16S rRNA G966 N2-methylase RsmD